MEDDAVGRKKAWARREEKVLLTWLAGDHPPATSEKVWKEGLGASHT